ncbi:MAG: amidohydrolase/deacetylase family metallohydrolase [Pseudomonadota bacterium]|nr:amidohydrolase/deacetylase family metallohydrolase [Pseudomonadota bacterium]
MKTFDLLLKGGHVIDPAEDIDQKLDVAFSNGKISKIANDIPKSKAKKVIDISNSILTPGLIDLHTHVYWGGTSLGIDPDKYCISSGLTTIIDTGSAGPGNFSGFRKHIIEKSRFRILVFLHISHAGIFAFSKDVMVGESENIRMMDPRSAIQVIKENQDLIVGVKVRLGKRTSGINGITPLKFAMEVAQECNLPIMAHIDEAPPSYSDLVKELRPGDILTHCFRPSPNGPLGQNGDILCEVLKARDRGILFDVGHGMGSFSFKTARKMLDKGFYPDTISSDIHALCLDGPVFDQLTTLSKFVALGLPFREVIRASTENASRALRMKELGSLKVGKLADASILKLKEGSFEYFDVTGEKLIGNKKIMPLGLVNAGNWVNAE